MGFLAYGVFCVAHRDGECGKHNVFAVLLKSVIAEGDGGGGLGIFRKCMPFVNIYLVFISELSMPQLSSVLCVAALADFFRMSQIFFPILELFFGRYFIFENASHFIFSHICCFLSFEILTTTPTRE